MNQHQRTCGLRHLGIYALLAVRVAVLPAASRAAAAARSARPAAGDPPEVPRPGAYARDDDTLASIVDFVPTILKMAGAKAPGDLPGLDLTDTAAMRARQTVFVEAYTHDIADLAAPQRSLIAQVVISGWSKLLIPGPARPDKPHSSAPREIELFDLSSDARELNNLALQRPDDVRRLKAMQDQAWK